MKLILACRYYQCLDYYCQYEPLSSKACIQRFVSMEPANTEKNLNSHETYRSDYPHTQTKESRRGNHCCFYRTLINLFLPFKPRLWYAKSRHLSLTFPRLTEKNGADPRGLSWMHQLEQTFLSCIRNVEIRSNGRTY